MKVISGLLNRLEPGKLWVHIARPGGGALTVASLVANLAIKGGRNPVICTYEGSIETMLPEDITCAKVPYQDKFAQVPSEYPVFIELGADVVPSARFSKRSVVIVEAARMSTALVDLDDWKELARDLRRPTMITWELEDGEDPEDFDFGEADYGTWSFFDPEKDDELVIRRVHEPT